MSKQTLEFQTSHECPECEKRLFIELSVETPINNIIQVFCNSPGDCCDYNPISYEKNVVLGDIIMEHLNKT